MDNTFGEKSRQNFRIEIENKNTIIKEITDFDLEQTLECGQCFRFYKQDEEDYVVVAFNKLLHIKQSGNQLIFFNTEKPDVENIWIPYFDLERDYNEIKSFLLKKDSKLEEAIKHAKDVATKKYRQAMLHRANAEDEKLDRCIECMKEHEQLAEWLEELKELREYKKKMKAQFLDDIENPLEPIKLSSALESEIFKYEYRKEYGPQRITPLDYTIIYALKHCLEEQLKGVE